MMSHPVKADARNASRRNSHYVDSSIQRSLLIAMVVLEGVLVAGLAWLVYWRLNELLDEGLYRVHLALAGPALTALAQEGFSLLGLFVALNVLALLVAEGIWSRHENLVVRDFATLVRKTRQLDFSQDTETRQQHDVLALMLAWRAHERTRFAAIRDQVAKLQAAVSVGEPGQDTREALQRLNKLLP